MIILKTSPHVNNNYEEPPKGLNLSLFFRIQIKDRIIGMNLVPKMITHNARYPNIGIKRKHNTRLNNADEP